jgi:hypothetical protein
MGMVVSMGVPNFPQPGEIRIGTTEREAAAARLGEHFAAGRLESAEFEERVHLAYQARTTADLRRLFVDLPEPQAQYVARPPRRRDRSMSTTYLLILLAIIAGVAIASRFPPFLFIGVFWFVFARGFGPWRRRWR